MTHTDTARLDWLERAKERAGVMILADGIRAPEAELMWLPNQHLSMHKRFKGATIRAAIDAAMEYQPKPAHVEDAAQEPSRDANKKES